MIEADIKVSQLLDRLILTPRNGAERGMLRAILTQTNPAIRFSGSADGLSVEAKDIVDLNLTSTEISIHWSEFAKVFVQNRKHVYSHMPEQIDKIKKIKLGDKNTAAAYLKDMKSLKVLDDHQLVNVACMTLPHGCGLCVFDEQGAGKTVTLIHAFDALVERNEIDFALIIAPKSMVSEWPVDFAKFMPGRYKTQSLIGSRGEKRASLSNKLDVVVTNFETAVTMEQELRAILRKYNFRSIMVVDESFFAKNLDAKRTQAIRRLREYCGRSFVLCGTPAPNSPVDLVQQFNIVDFGFTFDGVVLPKDREASAKVVQEIIEERGPFIRHLKSDVLPELQAKKFHRVMTQMQSDQLKMYKKMSDALINDLNEVDEQTFEKNKMSFLARRSSLLQICSNPHSVDKSYFETPTKILAIDELLEDLIDKKKEKVILWSFYTASLENMVRRYQKYNPVRYDGSVTDTAVRREAVRRFKEDEDTMLFIANPAAAGAGLNLQSARYAIYESMSNQAAHYLQSLDRIHRRGQKNAVEYVILLCEGTIEISEYDRLIQKELAAQHILGDKVIPHLTRESLLAELIS